MTTPRFTLATTGNDSFTWYMASLRTSQVALQFKINRTASGHSTEATPSPLRLRERDNRAGWMQLDITKQGILKQLEKFS
ncbi:unnamed protein product [Citrullus colocynthis]|uniref:Uncharacterized protein n=1 Tax=Citrullus colocynthis TaxID=252529 RepID=A0ABP0XQS6_9ROSI